MAINWPTSLDTLVQFGTPAAGDARNTAGAGTTAGHAVQHDNLSAFVLAAEAKLGVNGSAVVTSLDYLSKAASDPGHTHTTASITSVSETNIVTTFPGKYLLLAGRSGGQTAIGGTGSGDNLTLKSSSNATPGKVIIGTSAYDEVNNRLGLGTAAPGVTLDVSGQIRTIGTITNSAIDIESTLSTGTGGRGFFLLGGTISGAGDTPFAMQVQTTISPSASIGAAYGLRFIPAYSPPTTVTITTAYGILAQPVMGAAAGAITTVHCLYCATFYAGSLKPTSINGIFVDDVGSSGVTTAIGINMTKPTASTANYYFGFNTPDATVAGAYFGRIPVLYNGVAKFIHIFSA